MLDQIELRYLQRKAVLGVVGMGYIGLPLALAAAAAKYRVIGFDIDPKKVDRINGGNSYLKHIGSEQIAS
jgi:UDP-N-acetyl-D-glucosamine dehydrogenase